MEMVVTTGAIRRANLQSNVTANKPTPSFLKAGCPSCRPTNSVKALKGKPSANLLKINQNTTNYSYTVDVSVSIRLCFD